MTLKILGFLFFMYQGLTHSQSPTCRFRPTCSRYTLQAAEKHGLILGGVKAFVRILNCHPFTKRPVFDPA